MNRLLWGVLAVMIASGSARADTLPLVTPVPTQYTPGVALSFALQAPGITDFSSFNVDLIITTDDPLNPPNLVIDAPQPGGSEYVFGLTGTYSSSVSPGPLPNQLDLNISGTSLPGAPTATVAGVNDLLSLVTITPGADLTGVIRVEFDPSTLSFRTASDVAFTFTGPDPFEIAQGGVQPVPTPAAWLTMALGGLTLAVGRRRR